jgi:hypothetical protein
MIEGNLPPGFAVPLPSDDSTLRDDEDRWNRATSTLGWRHPCSPKNNVGELTVNCATFKALRGSLPGCEVLVFAACEA